MVSLRRNGHRKSTVSHGNEVVEDEDETRNETLDSNCMRGGSFANEGWVLKGFPVFKIWLMMYFAESGFGILQLDSVWQGQTGMDTRGLRYLSILLSWITGLDVFFAHAKLTTLATSSINGNRSKSDV